MMTRLGMLFAVLMLSAGCSNGGAKEKKPGPGKGKSAMKITSSAFKYEGMIPAKFTCDGDDINHDLTWSDVPAGTQTLALINDDPDAPVGLWVHWILYNVPAGSKGLPEGVVKSARILEDGTMQGINSWGRIGYGGPCPPSGTHRYFFKLYALDAKLDLDPGAKKDQVEKAMKGHILAEAVLMGKYSRK